MERVFCIEKKQPSSEQGENPLQKISMAMDHLHEVKEVNKLLQQMCVMANSDLSQEGFIGLHTILEWQNQHIGNAEHLIQSASEDIH